ncbi:tripartite tricarboxylate transporter substrate binding protein [Roseococcus sp. DSY-14]|uniref:tripartite tricarboxylate transporter substrate binding protein n=1 Tax=Roseococcus sp. DSY-14 TaxID=3369650 RepID=UPI00387B46B9
MRLPRRALAALLPAPALAQAPLPAATLVVPFTPGGAADQVARLLARHLPRHLGPDAPAITVENRPGASGALGTLAVARARPDGGTLLLARVAASAILPATDPRTPYAAADFTWLGLLDENPFVLAVRADSPWPDLPALLRALRDQPGALRFSTAGPATLLDLGVRQMLSLAGLPLDAAQAVALRGGGEAVAAVLSGGADFVGANMGDAAEALRAGTLRALLATAALPGVPDAAQAGLPGLAELSGWGALAGPAGMPDEVAARWAAGLAALGRDDGWVAALARLGHLPRPLDPAATRAHVESQVAMYRALAQRLGLG